MIENAVDNHRGQRIAVVSEHQRAGPIVEDDFDRREKLVIAISAKDITVDTCQAVVAVVVVLVGNVVETDAGQPTPNPLGGEERHGVAAHLFNLTRRAVNAVKWI